MLKAGPGNLSKRQRRKKTPESSADGIRVDAPNAPVEGSDAGDASDLSWAFTSTEVSRLRSAANRHFTESKRLLERQPPETSAAERAARVAIQSIVHGFWRAEGTRLEEAQHRLMHRIGRWTRRTFGCHLELDGNQYFETCPIQMAHRRMGFSPAFVADRICSICDQDLSQCEHRRGRSYWVRGVPGPDGYCRVCHTTECKHRPDRLYRAQVISIVKEVTELVEVSVVNRPAQPSARPTRISVSSSDLRAALGPEFRVGVPVSCDLCLGDCWGFTELGSKSS